MRSSIITTQINNAKTLTFATVIEHTNTEVNILLLKSPNVDRLDWKAMLNFKMFS